MQHGAGLAQQLERRCPFRLTPVQLDQRVQRILLCGHADFQRRDFRRQRLSCFGRKSVKRLSCAARLFDLEEISDPLDEPLLDGLLGVTAGLPARSRELLSGGFHDTTEDWFPILLGYPLGRDDAAEELGLVRRCAGQIQDPGHTAWRIGRSCQGSLQKRLHAVGAVAPDIGAEQFVRFLPQLVRQLRPANVFERHPHVLPERFGHSLALNARERLQGRFPVLLRVLWFALPPEYPGHAVVRIPAQRVELQGVCEIGESLVEVFVRFVIFGESEIGSRAAWCMFELRREIVFRIPLAGEPQKLPIPCAVIEPEVTGELLVPVHRFPDPIPHGAFSQGRQKGLVDLRGWDAVMQSHQAGVNLAPDRRE